MTRRELETMRLIAEGHSTKEVARRLGVSDKTLSRIAPVFFASWAFARWWSLRASR